jgi:Acetyltransferases, including N-acetylases of ribosomal proteins
LEIARTLSTDRLILRPWREEDAPSLYAYAKDPAVGPIAGWPVHPDVAHSRRVIADHLSGDGIFAIVLTGMDSPIGSIGVLIGEKSGMHIGEDEGEIGYWIGVPYWGRGLVPEAVRELMRHCFEEIGLVRLWCGYFDGNEQSRRVQEKCGFAYHHTECDKKIVLLDVVRTEHISCIARKEWVEENAVSL